MYCPNCGCVNPDEGTYCANCGQLLAEANTQQLPPVTYSQTSPDTSYSKPTAPYNGHPMKWYKFQIYFALFVIAAWYIYSGIGIIVSILAVPNTGNSGFEVWGYLTCLIMLGVAGFSIFVRQSLDQLKQNAPIFLLCLYCAACVSSIVGFLYKMTSLSELIKRSIPNWLLGFDEYADLVNAAVAQGRMTYIIWFAIELTVCITLIIINIIYFVKRKDIFIN